MLPTLYIGHRSHKARFTANSSSCTTTELSKLLTPCLVATKTHLIKFCEKVNETCGKMSRDMTKPTMWLCAQRRLRSVWASAQSDQSSLWAQWVAKGPSFLHADSEDSDQTGRVPRLI